MQRTITWSSLRVGLVSDADRTEPDDWGAGVHSKAMHGFGDPVTMVSGNEENGSLEMCLGTGMMTRGSSQVSGGWGEIQG